MKDELSSFLKIPDAVVVSEAFPCPEDFFLGSYGDRFDVRKFFKESFEAPIGDDRGDGGLLEHDLRNEDGPGICCFTPRMGFGIFREPSEKRGSKSANVLYRVTSGGGFFHGVG